MDIDIVKGFVIESFGAEMIKLLIFVGSCENNFSLLAHSNYSLDYCQNVDVDALALELLQLVLRSTERGKG
jgi:hypothetical protein